MDQFDLMVMRRVYFWLGTASGGTLALDSAAWDVLDGLYQEAWVTGLNARLPKTGLEKAAWWREGGEVYSRQCVERFVEKLASITTSAPSEDEIRRAYQEARTEMLALLERAGSKIFGDILCP